ncbi:MAG: rhomboid family intramembrane serine protease [Janthinobacterium lividum]
MFSENLRLKLRYIGWPYVQVLLGLLAGSALFHAALFTGLPQYEPPDWLWTFVGPIAGCLLLLALILWPNFRIIKEKQAGRGSLGQLLFIVALVVFVLAWSSIGHYLRAVLSPLQQVTTLAEINRHPPARYYQVQQLLLDSPRIGIEQQASITGKHNEHLDFTLFIACPVAVGADTTAAVPAWLGFRYTHEMSSRASQAEKAAAYREFLRTSEQQFNQDKVRPLTYLERSANDDKRVGLRTAATRSTRYRAGAEPPMVLLPVYRPFAQRGDSALHTLLWSMAIGNGLFLLLLLVLPLDEARKQELLAGQPIDRSRGWLGDYIQAFIPRPGYLATPLLLDANILIYLLMAASTTSGLNSFATPVLLAWGANYGPAIAVGEWWRLLTSTFLHGGLLHLANNMVLLGILGWQLERVLGALRVAVVYLLAGVGASLISCWWHPAIVGVGASGALFGWMGLGLTLYWRPQTDVVLKAVLGSTILITGALSLFLGFVIPNVDNSAHLGGLFIGALLGVVLWPWLRLALEASSLQLEEPVADDASTS